MTLIDFLILQQKKCQINTKLNGNIVVWCSIKVKRFTNSILEK